MKKIFEHLKARLSAKKFNIYTEKIDPNRKGGFLGAGDWYANGKLYFGHPLFIFFESAQNSWFLKKDKK